MGRPRRTQLVRVIGTNVAERRKGARLTQGELAERCKLTTKYVSEIERGLANPSLDVLNAIASALDTTLARVVAAPSEVDLELSALLAGRSAGERRRVLLVVRALFAE